MGIDNDTFRDTVGAVASTTSCVVVNKKIVKPISKEVAKSFVNCANEIFDYNEKNNNKLGNSLIEMYEKHKKIPFGILGLYISLILINLIFFDTKLDKKELNYNESPITVVEVFGVNKTILKSRKTDLYREELEIIKYFQDNISYENKVEVIGDSEQIFWEYVLTRYINNKEDLYTGKGQRGLELKYLNAQYDIEDADYIIYFSRTEYYKYLENKILNAGEIIFQNEFGGIVKCNK